MKTVTSASFLLSFLLLAGCDRDAGPSDEPEAGSVVPVVVESARLSSEAHEIAIPGQVRPARSAVISSRIQGEVIRLAVVPGQSVERGEILAELESGELEARVDRVRAELEAASLERERIRGLAGARAATPRELESAEARYRSARASLAEARSFLGYTTVRAPFDGVVTRKHAEAGNLVSPGMAMVELLSPGLFRLEAWVPESLARSVDLGDRMGYEVESAATSGSGPVSEIGPVVDPATRTVLVKVDLPDNPELRSGQYGRIFLQGEEARRLWVPEQSVVQRGQLEQLFVVSGDPPLARLRLIRTGLRRDGRVEVLSGLEDGELMVREVPAGLRDGQTVEIRE